jgi:hypothetical protein
MKINSVEYCLESDTIYINKTDLKNFWKNFEVMIK